MAEITTYKRESAFAELPSFDPLANDMGRVQGTQETYQGAGQVTGKQHPITPTPELVQQIRSDAQLDSGNQLDYALRLIYAAYRAGADQELAACVEWLEKGPYGFSIAASASDLTGSLRATRRPKPKPPSLAEHGLKILDGSLGLLSDEYPMEVDTIRAALERLQELENNG